MKKNFLFLLSTVIVLTFISCNHENGNNNQTLEVEIIHNAVTDFDGNKGLLEIHLHSANLSIMMPT